MSKSIKIKTLAILICLFTLALSFAFGTNTLIAEGKQGRELIYTFDSALFVNKAETSTAKLSCQDGFMHIKTTSTNTDGFQYSLDAPQDIESIDMDDYNYIKFKLKRNAVCQSGSFQLYFWNQSDKVNYRSEFTLAEEYNDKWVEVIVDLRVLSKTETCIYVKNVDTGVIKEQPFSDYQANSNFTGNLYSMRLNFSRGNSSKEKQAWVEYMAFFENKEDAMAFNGLAKERLTSAEQVLKGELAPSEFALPEREEEKIVKLAQDYTEGLLGISTEIVNYSYSYPTKTEYGYIDYDAILCSGGYYHFVEGVRLTIEPEPNDPVLYKFDNQQIIDRLISQQKMSVEAYFLDGVMKIVQADPYQDDGFWVLIDTVADNNRFLMQTYPIIQYRINVTGQAPSQLFFANYGSYYSYHIGYDEGEWLTVTLNTGKTAGAVKVENEDKGTIQYLDSVNNLYKTDFTPPAFRGLSDEFRFNFGRRSGIERFALVDYIAFFPTVESAENYAEENRGSLETVKTALSKNLTLDFMNGSSKESAENQVKLTLEKLTKGAFDIEVNTRTYVSPVLNQTDGSLVGSVVLSNENSKESLTFSAIINCQATDIQNAFYFGSDKVLDYLSAGDGTTLSFDKGLVVSGENRKVSTVGLDLSDRINLNPYKFVKIGFEGNVSGAIDLSLITENQTKTYQQTLSGDSVLIEIADAIGIMQDFSIALSNAGQTTIKYIAFFENSETAGAFTSKALDVTLQNVKLNEIIAAQCYNEREAKREALKAVEKQLPLGCVAEIIPVEMVKPTRNATGYFRFKALLTSDSVFGPFAVESQVYTLPIAKISYYETEEFYFNGKSYAVSEKAIKNEKVQLVELTFMPTGDNDGLLLKNGCFEISVIDDEIVVSAKGTKLLETTTLSLSGRGKTRLAVAFEQQRTTLYVDGILVASGDALTDRTGESVIYVAGSDTDAKFDGTLGEIKVWNKIPSKEDISRYAFEKMQGTEEGLVAYWRTENDYTSFINRVDGSNFLTQVDEYTHYYHEFTGYDFLKSAKALSYEPKTVELWVKGYKENQGAKTLISNDLSASPDAQSFALTTTATGGLKLRYGSKTLTIDEISIYNGRWTHVAFTFGTTETKFYLNGMLQKTFNEVCSGALSAKNYYFGTHTDAFESAGFGGGKFKGELANVRFWSTLRSATEIAENKQTLFAQNTDGLLWNLTLNASKDLVFADTVSGNSVSIVSESWYKIINEETCDYWTAVILPDPQDYLVASTTRQGKDWDSYDEWRFYNFNMMINDWIIDNKDKENIQMVLSVGDMTQNATQTEFEVLSEHMAMLDGIVPYTLVLGNHDLQSAFGYGSDTRGSEVFKNVFKYDEWKLKDYYGGSFEEGSLDNTYYFFNVGQEKIMVMCLEFVPRDEVLEWADYIIKKYSDYKVILTTHEYLNATGQIATGIPDYGLASKDGATTNNGEEMFHKLVKNNPNVLQFMSGHVGGGLNYSTSVGTAGNTVQQIVADTWSTAISNNPTVEGLIAICRYYEDGRTSVYLYDPTVNSYYVSGLRFEEDLSEERGV